MPCQISDIDVSNILPTGLAVCQYAQAHVKTDPSACIVACFHGWLQNLITAYLLTTLNNGYAISITSA